MANFKRVRPGDSIAADDFNAIAEQIERFANLGVAGNNALHLWSGPTGKSLTLATPRETIARLSGTGSPYSWTEVWDAGSGTYTDRINANSGESNAYEVNGVSGLDGEIVWLTWSAARDWRFQWAGYGSSPPPCASGRICVTIESDGCTPATPVYGATVTVTDSADPPNLIGTCTTSGQVTELALTGPGSGYSDGTGYLLGISGDGSGASGTFDVIDGQVTNLALSDGGSGYTSATITFPGAGAGTGAAASGLVKGRCCIEIPAADTYHVTVQVPGLGPHRNRERGLRSGQPGIRELSEQLVGDGLLLVPSMHLIGTCARPRCPGVPIRHRHHIRNRQLERRTLSSIRNRHLLGNHHLPVRSNTRTRFRRHELLQDERHCHFHHSNLLYSQHECTGMFRDDFSHQ